MEGVEQRDEFEIAADEYFKRRAEAPPPVIVKMKHPTQIPSETEVESDKVWAFKLAGWSEL